MDDALKVLVVDDEDSIRKRCLQLLARQGYEVVGAADSRSALGLVRSQTFDLVLTDIRMPGVDGIELLERIKEYDPGIEVVVMTGYAAVDTAVKALKTGARDYISKPFDIDELTSIVKAVASERAAKPATKIRGAPPSDGARDHGLVGRSPAIRKVLEQVEKLAAVDCIVMIDGENGTGKALVARAIHDESPRRNRPFVVADCAALAGSVLESELFGHVKGAFTGAYADRVGYFESARGGTLFLDEIGDMPLALQGKLLRAVQDREVTRVGDTKPYSVDVRIIAATNRDLEEQMAQKLFRRDLYYRLNVARVTMPALRERKEDIAVLVEHFLPRYSAELGHGRKIELPPDVLGKLIDHDWPGNVRELQNAIHRALIFSDGQTLAARELLPSARPDEPPEAPEEVGPADFQQLRREADREFLTRHLAECLRRHEGNVTHVAEELGMRRTSLQRLMKQHGIVAADYRR